MFFPAPDNIFSSGQQFLSLTEPEPSPAFLSRAAERLARTFMRPAKKLVLHGLLKLFQTQVSASVTAEAAKLQQNSLVPIGCFRQPLSQPSRESRSDSTSTTTAGTQETHNSYVPPYALIW